MRKSIVLSTRTDIIVVAKLAQFYEQQMDVGRPRTKSALIDMCLRSLLTIIKNNKMLKEDEVIIDSEEKAFKYLTKLGYNLLNKDGRLTKDMFRNIQKETVAEIEEDIEIIKKSLQKADEDII